MTGIILGILGIFVTVVLSYYGILLAKKYRQVTSLEIKNNECFSLFNAAVRNLKIDIKYSGKDVNKTLILFKGEILNTGTLDIDKSSIYDPLKLIAPENYNWLEINLTDEDSKVGAVVNMLNKKEFTIVWDLLKKKEKIPFEALIESNVSDKEVFITEAMDFYNSINFNFRITNLDHITCDDKLDHLKVFRKSMYFEVLFLFIGVFLSGAIFSLDNTNKYFLSSSDFADVYFNINSLRNDSIIISTIVPISTDLLLIEEKNTKNKQLLSQQEFSRSYNIVGINSMENNFSFIYLLKGAGILILLFWIINFIGKYRGYKKKYLQPK